VLNWLRQRSNYRLFWGAHRVFAPRQLFPKKRVTGQMPDCPICGDPRRPQFNKPAQWGHRPQRLARTYQQYTLKRRNGALPDIKGQLVAKAFVWLQALVWLFFSQGQSLPTDAF